MATLNPYISFRDTARSAMEFYQTVFGGDLTLSTFGESQLFDDPSGQDKIMHGMLKTPSGMVLMGADTPNSMDEAPTVSNISVSLSGNDNSELRGYWASLTVEGTITMPLEVAPWGDAFGMCVDKFGVSWMMNIAAK